MNIKRILITGSEGNIGSELCPYLIEKGHHIIGADIKHKYGDRYIMCDINHPGDLTKFYDEYSPHVVIHMAAKVSRIDCEKSPGLTVDTNLSGLHNVIQMCLKNNAKLIYFSTSEVYGNIDNPLSENMHCNPNNIYGLTKLLGEKLIIYFQKYYGLNAIILRPFMIYNPKQKSGEDKAFINRLVYKLLNKEKVKVHKNSIRSWLHINDFVVAVEKCISLKGNYIINIGHPKIIETSNLALLACEILNIKYSDYIIDVEQPGKMTLEKEPLLEYQKQILNFEPSISIKNGIQEIINLIKCNQEKS